MIFQSLLERIGPVFKWYDEVLALVVFGYAIAEIFYKGKAKKNKYYIYLIVCILIYMLLGTISSCVYQYQSLGISIVSAFLSAKWFALLVGGYAFSDRFISEKDFYGIKAGIYFDGVILFVWTCLSYLGMLGNTYYIYAWDLCAKSVFIAGSIMATWKNNAKDIFTIILTLAMLIMSGKAKGYAAVVLIAICVLWIIKKEKKIKLSQWGILIAMVVFVAWDKIYFYYAIGAAQDYARYRVFKTSIDIANDHFPIGTGWGAYGSKYAAEIYSPVYYLYGIDKHPELGVQNKLYLNDNYWPIVIAETGWIGLIAMGILCLVLFMYVQKAYKIDKRIYATGILIFCYMMITTVEETGFAQPVLACLGFLMGIVMLHLDKKEETYCERQKLVYQIYIK